MHPNKSLIIQVRDFLELFQAHHRDQRRKKISFIPGRTSNMTISMFVLKNVNNILNNII